MPMDALVASDVINPLSHFRFSLSFSDPPCIHSPWATGQLLQDEFFRYKKEFDLNVNLRKKVEPLLQNPIKIPQESEINISVVPGNKSASRD